MTGIVYQDHRCPRCGAPSPVPGVDPVTSAMIASLIKHRCRRYLVAEFWQHGVIEEAWSSDRPGVTGPAWLVAEHGNDEVWVPPARGGGWVYRWVDDVDGGGGAGAGAP